MHVETRTRERATYQHFLSCSLGSCSIGKLITQRSADSYIDLEQLGMVVRRTGRRVGLCDRR